MENVIQIEGGGPPEVLGGGFEGGSEKRQIINKKLLSNLDNYMVTFATTVNGSTKTGLRKEKYVGSLMLTTKLDAKNRQLCYLPTQFPNPCKSHGWLIIEHKIGQRQITKWIVPGT